MHYRYSNCAEYLHEHNGTIIFMIGMTQNVGLLIINKPTTFCENQIEIKFVGIYSNGTEFIPTHKYVIYLH